MIIDYYKLNLAVTSIIPAVQNAIGFIEEINIAPDSWHVATDRVTAFFLFPMEVATPTKFFA